MLHSSDSGRGASARWDPETLARRINDEHEAARLAVRTGIAHAITAGELLLEAKRMVPHGQWRTWLGESVAFSERTAQAYMRLAKARCQLTEENPQALADLTLTEALSRLARRGSAKHSLEGKQALDALRSDLAPGELVMFVKRVVEVGVSPRQMARYIGRNDRQTKAMVKLTEAAVAYLRDLLRELGNLSREKPRTKILPFRKIEAPLDESKS